MKFREYSFKDLPEEVYRELLPLHLGEEGSMEDQLRKKRSDSKLFICEDNGVAGWGILCKVLKSWEFHVFVKEEHRGKGVGHKLYRMARNRVKKFYVFPHDEISKNFYLTRHDKNLIIYHDL